MSIASRIEHEVLSLPNDLQRKVLGFVEWLKYRDLVQKAAQMAAELGGIQSFTEEDIYRLFEQSTQGDSQENLVEKIALAERVIAALHRMQLGVEGIPNQEMKNRAKPMPALTSHKN